PAVRLHARAEERAHRDGAALDQCGRAPPRAGRADRHASGTAAQIRPPEPARRHPRAAARRRRRRVRRRAGPVLHADRRRARRKHPRAARREAARRQRWHPGGWSSHVRRGRAESGARRGETPRGAKRAHAVRAQTADRRDEAGPAALRTHRVGALLRPAGTNREPRTANREPRPATPEPAVKILYSAIDHPVPGTTGGSVNVAAIPEGQAALGHDVTALVTPGVGTPPPSAVRWIPMRPPFGSTHLRLLRSGAIAALARGLRPDAIIERYHNFG